MEVERQAEQAKVPAHPDRARAVLLPHVGGTMAVCSSTSVAPVARRASRTSTSDSAGLAPPPAQVTFSGSAVAVEDLAAGVALELVAAAEAEVAADRQEPAADPLGLVMASQTSSIGAS